MIKPGMYEVEDR